MSKCFILGAGFSKAVANLPLMSELTKKFWEVLENEKTLGHRNRVILGERIKNYFWDLEKEFFVNPCVDVKNGEKWHSCNYEKNLEQIISFIDLNLSGEINATLVTKNGKTQSFSKRNLFWNYTDLDELRLCIQTYIYLALIEPKINKNLLKLFINHLSKGDNIITFNYDLVLERALYEDNYWHPKDGYGIIFNNFPAITKQDNLKSIIHIYKLHGSLNWQSDTILGLDKYNNIKINSFYDDNTPIFPGYLQDEKNNPFIYEGKHSGIWILPSFIKQFDIPQLLQIWEKAGQAINNADEIIVIGYSLPKEDSAAGLLLGTNQISDKKLIIIDPNEDELFGRYLSITRNPEPITFKSLEEYLKNF